MSYGREPVFIAYPVSSRVYSCLESGVYKIIQVGIYSSGTNQVTSDGYAVFSALVQRSSPINRLRIES
jgi:hypothetical protein